MGVFEPTLEATIDCSRRAPAEARRVVERLGDRIDVGLLRDLQLLISELVTNSVRHSGSRCAIHLRAWTRPGGLKVEIADGGYGFVPDATGGGVDDEGGRGLLILDTLAERWGVSADGPSRVWFELESRSVSGTRAQAG